MVFKYDFLIIGAGVAGMSYALKVARAHKGKVCMICKTSLDEANTSFAQGGVASVTNLAVDNFDKHIEDTMIAGDFISDRRAVEQVVRNAPEQIAELVKWGVNFDRKEEVRVDWNVFASEVEEEFHVSDTQMVWNISVRCEPIKPSAPVTNTFFIFLSRFIFEL